MASSEILSQTLSSITSIKLDQLGKQKAEYQAKKQALLEDVDREADVRKRVELLLEGAGKLPTMSSNPLISASNLKRFVEQAQYDPSVSNHFLQDYESALRNGLQVQSNKYDFASLYGQLVNEWTAAGKRDRTDAEEEFVPVGREEMHEQRAMWEEYVFKPKEVDGTAIRAYLDRLFNESKDVKCALDTMLNNLKTFQERWDRKLHFTEEVLTNCINGMLRSDVLNDEKRATVRDFLGNKVVLSEIADVLNMRMSTRSSWRWDTPLIIEQRRNLNGRYRFYPDEDILHSIFIYYIGRVWAVQLNTELKAFLKSTNVWKRDTAAVTKEDARRRDFFLYASSHESYESLAQLRQKHYHDDILLDQLPHTMEEVRGGYGDESKGEDDDSRKSHSDVTQQLLHRIQAEILLQTKLGRDITVIRSDFKWFGPSIPHSSILAVLEFFGVTSEWRDFFRRVLEAPLKFAQDPADAEPQLRRRGTPLSTPLADLFGESLLFCLDFAVNQRADGVKLYRLHDDMWVYGSEHACTKAWAAMADYTAVMGLEFNEKKTGSVQVRGNGKTGSLATGLPKGDVVWGFLKLDPATGRFLIDQEEVNRHIEELRIQLGACKSVFDWTQAWNLYGARFFANNFGRPAACYGRDHVDAMLATFQRIQQRLFPDAPGGVSEHLKNMIETRFGVRDVPDGYLYFPHQLGGLGLQNPFVKLFLVRGQVTEDPGKFVDEFLQAEEAQYRRAKEAFAKDGHQWHRHMDFEFKDLKQAPFMSLDEFVRYRDSTSALLGHAFQRLLAEPGELDVELKGEVKAALDEGDWYGMDHYERWIIQLFFKDMLTRFGGLNIVDKGLLPMGLMGMLRQSRFRWQG